MLHAYANGKTCEEIAAEYNVDGETIRQLLLRHRPEIIRERGPRKKDPRACTTLLTLEGEMKIVDYYRAGKSLDEIEKLTGISDSTVSKIIRQRTPHLMRPPTRLGKPIKPQPSDLAPEKAYLIGHFIGDGGLSKSYRIRYSNTCQKLIEEVSKTFVSVYGLKSRIRQQKDGTLNVDWFSKKAWNDLKLYTDYKCKKWRVPTEILENPEDLAPPFLRALFDDDGCVALNSSPQHNGWQRWVCLRSINIQGCEDIVRLLSLFKIDSRKADKAVIISRKHNIELFQHIVGFTDGVKVLRGRWKGFDKAEVLKLLLKSYEDFTIPHHALLKVNQLQ